MTLLRRVNLRPNQAVERNYFVGRNGQIPSLGTEYHRQTILDAVNEAWDWLFINGLMVGASGEDWNRSRADMEGHRIISRKGSALLNADDPMGLIRVERLLALPLHPRIEAKARIQFAIGAYGSAVHEAFRELEIRVREAGGYDASKLGTSLMEMAFSANGGPLTDSSMLPAEQLAIMRLYVGAIGAFKNPLSHRTVDYDDPTIAAEQLLFADLLHRMLDGFIAVKNAQSEGD